jgi:hypothetical protein
MNDSDHKAAKIREAIEEAIEFWAGPYNRETIARIKGDDTMAYRLRSELSGRIMLAIRRATAKSN